MFRSDQTRYHQEWVGFSKTITHNNNGLITAFAPSDSLQFLDRFKIWRGFRLIGWTCTVNIIKNENNGNQDGAIAFAPFNQSLLGSATFVAPNSFPALLELPNCKVLPTNANNPRSKATFQWFNRKGDINALPFQALESYNATAEYATGLVSFSNAPDGISYELYGKMLLQFKDKNFINANATNIADDYEIPVVKRLNKVRLLNH